MASSKENKMFLRKNIAGMAGYVPGFQPEDDGWIKLNTNENPYPPSPKVIEAIQAELTNGGERLRKYPDAACRAGREAAARLFDYPPEWLIMANGSDELLNNLIRACVGEGEEVAFLHPSYSYYATLVEVQGGIVRTFPLTEQGEIQGLPAVYHGRLFFLTNPNAPFGTTWASAAVAALADRCRGLLVIDEAYVDFAEESCLKLVRQKPNVVVTRTLSKSYGLAGMRLGMAVARPEIIAALDKIRDHYNLDRLAQVALVAALSDQTYFRDCVARICATREWFQKELLTLGYAVIPSGGNYLFVIPPDRDGQRVYEALFARRILVRFFNDPILAHGLRISIGTDQEMARTLATLAEIG